LWRGRDAVAPLVVAAVGVVLCAVAWWLAAGERQFREELSLSTVSVIGLVLVLSAETAWILRGRAIVGQRARALLGTVPAAPSASPEAPASPPPTGDDDRFVVGPGLRRYHRPDCDLAVGQHWPAATRREHLRAGRLPCGICRPDGPSDPAA